MMEFDFVHLRPIGQWTKSQAWRAPRHLLLSGCSCLLAAAPQASMSRIATLICIPSATIAKAARIWTRWSIRMKLVSVARQALIPKTEPPAALLAKKATSVQLRRRALACTSFRAPAGLMPGPVQARAKNAQQEATAPSSRCLPQGHALRAGTHRAKGQRTVKRAQAATYAQSQGRRLQHSKNARLESTPCRPHQPALSAPQGAMAQASRALRLAAASVRPEHTQLPVKNHVPSVPLVPTVETKANRHAQESASRGATALALPLQHHPFAMARVPKATIVTGVRHLRHSGSAGPMTCSAQLAPRARPPLPRATTPRGARPRRGPARTSVPPGRGSSARAA